MAGRFYSADELIDTYLYGGPVPVSQWRRPNAGQLCAKSKRIVGHRAINDGARVWHVECDESFTTLSMLNSSNSTTQSPENQIECSQPHLDSSVGGGSRSVKTKTKKKVSR
jgi:hypothetical protein